MTIKEEDMLNQKQFEAKWTEIKAGFRNVWGKLTDEDLENVKYNLYDITNTVERKYDETKAEINKKISKLLNSFDNDTDKNIDPDVSSYHRSPV